MKKNRVDCFYCTNFIRAEWEDDNWFSKMIVKPGCKLGKRVMFRQPRNPLDDEYGWFRYCDEFNDKINEK